MYTALCQLNITDAVKKLIHTEETINFLLVIIAMVHIF